MENIQLVCNLCCYFPRFTGIYSNRHHIALYNHIFVSVLITDDDHIDRMRWNTEAASPILQLTSALASPSYARILPTLSRMVHIINLLPANSDLLQ